MLRWRRSTCSFIVTKRRRRNEPRCGWTRSVRIRYASRIRARMFIRLLLLATAVAHICAAQSLCDADAAFRSAQNLLAHKQYEQAAKTLDGLRRCATLSHL